MMKLISIFIVIALNYTGPSLLNFVAPVSLRLQGACSSLIQSDIFGYSLVNAFFCGCSLNDGPLRELWVTTSLYHLLVVSGSHLVFVMALIEIFRESVLTNQLFNVANSSPGYPRFILNLGLGLVLILFTLMTGFQAPIVRALLARVLTVGNAKFKWGWPPDLLVLFSGVLCLILIPEWVHSRSLILSWMASLALTQGRSTLAKASLVFVFALPCLWGWGQLNPYGILINICLAPIQTLLLLSSGILLWPLPGWAEQVLKLSVFILKTTAEITPKSDSGQPLDLIWVWLSLILVTTFIHTRRVVTLRQS